MAKKVPKPLTYNATIVDRVDLTDLLSTFIVQPEDKEGDLEDIRIKDFVPGQYNVLGANNVEESEKGSVRRSYSIASPPAERRWFEYYIRLVTKPESDNPLTPLLWKMKKGDRLWVGPKITGHFTISNTVGEGDNRLKLFVAAGTGLAPFYSMVMDCVLKGGDFLEKLKSFVILHGASHPEDLGYKNELEQVASNHPFYYFPSVSRPHLHPEWGGDQGRVESYFDEEKLDELEERMRLKSGYIRPENCIIYICGLQGTIAQTLIRSLGRGFIPHDRKIRKALQFPDEAKPSLFYEQYDTDPIIDLKDESLLEVLREKIPKGIGM